MSLGWRRPAALKREKELRRFEEGLKRSSRVSDWKNGFKKKDKPVSPSRLSEFFGSFGDLENFVNVIGENCDEVRPRVPGHVGAEREFTHILWILHIPDLWHTAARPERERERERLH